MMLVGCSSKSTSVTVQCEDPNPADTWLLLPTPVPPPPLGALTEPVVIEHFRILYEALEQCNLDKQEFIHVYYPKSLPFSNQN